MDEQQRPLPDDFFTDWKDREALAEGMIPIIGKLYRQSNISTYMYGNSMVNKSVTDIMQEHRFVRQVEHNEISEFDTFPMLEGITKLQLGPAHIDLGKMVVKFQNSNGDGRSLEDFLTDELSDIIGSQIKPLPEPQDVVLYGFGRIGRLIARILVDKAGGGDVLRLRAIVIRKGNVDHDLEKRAALLRRDSVHGPFKGTVRVLEDQNTLVVNGNPVKIIYANSPAEIDYTQYGISNALIVDNTGVWKDTEGLSGHLRPGASKVLLTAPAGDDIPNIVYGVNHKTLTGNERIVSAASCSTNCVVPVISVLDECFGVEGGVITTIHSAMNDQPVIDAYHHTDLRKTRAAMQSIIPVDTGLALGIDRLLPQLAGRFQAQAMRVPTVNVSAIDLSIMLSKPVDVDTINSALAEAAGGVLQGVLGYTEEPLASCDFNHDPRSGIVDSSQTRVSQKKLVKVLIWFDNEWGYANRMLDTLKHWSTRFPAED